MPRVAARPLLGRLTLGPRTAAAGVLLALGTTAGGALLADGTASAAPRLQPAGAPVVTGVRAALPRLVRALPSGIEQVTPYIPQDDCDPTAKPGTVALMNLLLSTYKDSRSLGIVSTCAAEKMVSEHSDGRALDWGVALSNAQQNKEAQAFLTWLFAPDADGNEQAMARRLGVMYVIWDGRIRSTGGDWQPYDASYCWKGGKVGGQRAGDVTQCHRNHIHISLAWNGALKKTSFWSGKVAPVDYGPCVPKGKKWAVKYTGFNGSPCSGDGRSGGTGGSGGTTSRPTPSPVISVTPVQDAPTGWPTDGATPTTDPTATWTWPTADPTASWSPEPTDGAPTGNDPSWWTNPPTGDGRPGRHH